MIKDILTIVIPCKNENLVIQRTLSYLNMQKDIDGTKVIIADVSDDGGYTRDCILSESNKNIDIEIIKGGYPSQGRNAGAKLVTTEYVLFLDADIFLCNNYILIDLLNEIEKRDTLLATCKFRVLSGEYNYVYKAFDFIQKLSKISKTFAIGGFMLFKTETFKKLGGFNEKNKIAEDYYISQKIKPKKFKIINSFVYTSSRRFSKKGVWYMIKLAVLSWLNRKNENFFNKDYKNYWK